MNEINLDDAKIKVDGKWLSSEELTQKIKVQLSVRGASSTWREI